jgi:hypothetical protein
MIPSIPTQNETNDTLDGIPGPLVYNNTGNVGINVSTKANAALWALQPLNTSYFQYADQNSSSWQNWTLNYTFLHSNLSYQSLPQELEVRVWAPVGEPAGTKNTTITVLGASIE